MGHKQYFICVVFYEDNVTQYIVSLILTNTTCFQIKDTTWNLLFQTSLQPAFLLIEKEKSRSINFNNFSAYSHFLSSRANIKSRNTTPPSLARNSVAGVLTNKRKTYTDSFVARYVQLAHLIIRVQINVCNRILYTKIGNMLCVLQILLCCRAQYGFQVDKKSLKQKYCFLTVFHSKFSNTSCSVLLGLFSLFEVFFFFFCMFKSSSV